MVEILLICFILFLILLFAIFYKKFSEELKSKDIELATLRAQNEAKEEKYIELKSSFEEQKRAFREEMENSMQKLMDAKMQKFDETSLKSIETLLNPFKENIEGFKKKVEEAQKESGEKISALSRELELVAKAGINISQEAQNLTRALKGQKQAQGRWGEVILESILESSGLTKDEHFFTQESTLDDDGSQKRPDVVIKLPNGKILVIDSKVSLNDYERFVSNEQNESDAHAVARAFKTHIDTLAQKNYTALYGGSLEYTLMFVPLEGAYVTAMVSDKGLYEHAYRKKIVLVCPSTLIATLKTIYLYWQKESADKSVQKIIEEASKMYEKACGFAESFIKIGAQIETLQRTYQSAHTQLSGRGSLLGKIENLKDMGAKSAKSLKEKIEFDGDD